VSGAAEFANSPTPRIREFETLEQASQRHDGGSASYSAGFRSALTAPLIWQGGAIGSLQLKSQVSGTYDDRSVAIITRIADQISGSVAANQHFVAMKAAAETREKSLLLDAENRRLEKEGEFKSDLLSTVSHELRTPLTSISAYADLLGKNSTDNLSDRQLEYVTLIRKGSSLLFFLINDLLTASQLNSGQFELVRERVAIADILSEAHEAIIPIVNEKNQKLSMHSVCDLSSVIVDRIRFAQILTNLLSNASKYSDEHSVIHFDAHTNGDSVDFIVRDEGPGIPAESIENLFTTQFRADDLATRSQEGTGLGLYIVKSLTELHGGTVEVESELGIGTTFVVSIPSNEAREQQ